MANIAVQRIKRELKEVLNSDEVLTSSRHRYSCITFFCLQVARCSIHVELVGESFSELRGEIAGPPDTPYEGARFQLEIKIPETYPFNPPKVRFITRIWHPNVSSVTGAICLDILKVIPLSELVIGKALALFVNLAPVGCSHDSSDSITVTPSTASCTRT